MKNFDEWNEQKKKVETYTRAPVRAGEIYWCRMGINVGVEQDGKGENFQRPILVLKKYSHQIILGAPLTTKIHKGNWYFDNEDLRDVQRSPCGDLPLGYPNL